MICLLKGVPILFVLRYCDIKVYLMLYLLLLYKLCRFRRTALS